MISRELYEYAVQARRTIHRHPELGTDLPVTVAYVKGELEKLGLEHTEKYGTCSVVTEIRSPLPDAPVLAVRADMDALPVKELTGLPYASEVEGAMHACGHDSHTAVLLALAKLLTENQEKLPCNVRLMFQPSEECAFSGGKMMVENGVLEGADAVIATHCENELDAGIIGFRTGDYMAACIPVDIRFHGRASHAAADPKGGIDAIAMAVEAYSEMKKAVAEEAGERKYIWSVGVLQGGEAHNIVPAECSMKITFRYYDKAFALKAMSRVEGICHAAAEKLGGSVDIEWHESAAAIHNSEAMTAQFLRYINAENSFVTKEMPARMSSEDFSWFLSEKPGMIFRFGTRNEGLGCTTLAHHGDFMIDETGMKSAIEAFYTFIMNFHGIEGDQTCPE